MTRSPLIPLPTLSAPLEILNTPAPEVLNPKDIDAHGLRLPPQIFGLPEPAAPPPALKSRKLAVTPVAEVAMPPLLMNAFSAGSPTPGTTTPTQFVPSPKLPGFPAARSQLM